MVDRGNLQTTLGRQWDRVAQAARTLDLSAASRIPGWRNAEVLAHLSVQPVLLGRFLAEANTAEPAMDLADNLAGTHRLAERIDEAAREGAEAGSVDFARRVAAVDAALRTADVNIQLR